MNWYIFILLLIGAYFVGAIPLAYLIAKWAKGIDLRKVGSGNVGFTNLATVTSKWLSVPVLVFDLGKGALAVYVARWAGLPQPLQGLVGIAAVSGHNWPVFLGFNAGRGLLTTVGVALALAPKLASILLVITLLGIPFHILPITSLITVLSLTFFFLFSNAPGISWLFIEPVKERVEMALVCFILWLIMVIRRLTAPKNELTQTVSPWELFFNRLFLDRDIRDRKLWIKRNMVKGNEG